MISDGKFYLGRRFDPGSGKVTDQPLEYDPADLTTHAVVVGMTGSGKTGLCLDLMEEAALNGIPALMIDPKGDICNALLHFASLRPEDFLPWVNPDLARRAGKTLDQAALEAAAAWRTHLTEWGITPERLRRLGSAVEYAVYTPGSEAGLPVSILSSLKAPALAWEGSREALREKISGTVTALLGLVGLTDIDPVRSREHILLANVFEHAWSQGKDLTLEELILQAQNPPFSRLGVFDVNTFFPEKDRFALAMQLNNILAAPAFGAWIEGQPLDIASLLYTPEGRPRHSIFYIAHLTDAERMFFVTLLYSTVEAWMRAQPGTASLRALVYFDEISGYLPPVSSPPSKGPILRMLKQARAFGVGQVLVTQNPVDVDYKALSNAGTWFIGKLQTEQDKQRLLDGLQGASPGGLDRAEYDRLISALGQRVFLLHNVHAGQPVLFQTRWAMNYLAGPLTRAQIPALNRLAASGPVPAAPTHQPTLLNQPSSLDNPRSPASLSAFQPIPVVPAADANPQPRPSPDPQSPIPGPQSPSGSLTRPPLPSGVAEYFLPNNLTVTRAFQAAGRAAPAEYESLGLLYRPALLAQAVVRFLNRKYNLDYNLPRTALVAAPDRRGILRWENYLIGVIDGQSLGGGPVPQARYAPLEAPLSDPKLLANLEKDFVDWVYRSSQVTIRANEALKVFGGPETTQADFRAQCANAAREGREAEARKISETYDRKLEALQARLDRETRELSDDETEFSQRRMEEWGTHAENVLGLFGGRRSRRLSTSLNKHRLTEHAKADVEESRETIADYQRQWDALEKEKAQALEEINQRWSNLAIQAAEIPLAPYKKDVLVDLFGVAWFPYHLVQVGPEVVELPGFGQA